MLPWVGPKQNDFCYGSEAPVSSFSMEKRTQFPVSWLPYALVAPQLAITIVFFIWPAGQALWQSMLVQDAFATHTEFVWFENFTVLFADPTYIEAFRVTAVF